MDSPSHEITPQANRSGRVAVNEHDERSVRPRHARNVYADHGEYMTQTPAQNMDAVRAISTSTDDSNQNIADEWLEDAIQTFDENHKRTWTATFDQVGLMCERLQQEVQRRKNKKHELDKKLKDILEKDPNVLFTDVNALNVYSREISEVLQHRIRLYEWTLETS
jgi:predicted NodU family carbamoyl transferase